MVTRMHRYRADARKFERVNAIKRFSGRGVVPRWSRSALKVTNLGGAVNDRSNR